VKCEKKEFESATDDWMTEVRKCECRKMSQSFLKSLDTLEDGNKIKYQAIKQAKLASNPPFLHIYIGVFITPIINMKLASIIFQSLCSILWLTVSRASDLANVKVLQTLYISHSTSSESSFTDRGTITLTLDESNNLQVNIDNNNSIPKIEGNLNALYKVRVSSSPQPDDHDNNTFVQTSVPLCSIMQANFRDELELTLSPTGSVLSISYNPLVSPLAPSCEEVVKIMEEDQKERSFQSKATVQIGKEGIAIPLLVQSKPVIGYKWLKQVRKEGSSVGATGENKADGAPFVDPTRMEEGTQNQSFLRKYWYIILPITLMSMLGGEDPQPKTSSSGATAAATSSVLAGASSASRQRRGKRN
jgi:hypothetical protein